MRWTIPLLLMLAASGCFGASESDRSEPEMPEAHPAAPSDTPSGQAPNQTIATPGPTAADFSFATHVIESQGWEPTVGIDNDGNMFVASVKEDPGLLAYRVMSVFRSTDGLTWSDVSPSIGPISHSGYTALDPYLHVDVDTGRVFASMLNFCHIVLWSDDLGETWFGGNPDPCTIPLADHQTVWTAPPVSPQQTLGYPNVVYQCNNQWPSPGLAFCTSSLDGGLTWGAPTPVHLDRLDDSMNPISCGLVGHGASHNDGTLWLPAAHCSTPRAFESTDGGLTWTEHLLPGGILSDDDPALAVAPDGAIGFVAQQEDRIAFSTFDGGWSPTQLLGNGTAVQYPTIASTRDGFAIAYYERFGEDDWRLSVEQLSPGNASKWTSPDSVMRSPSVGGAGEGGVGDFMDIAVGLDGTILVGYADGCDGCEPSPSPVRASLAVAIHTPNS